MSDDNGNEETFDPQKAVRELAKLYPAGQGRKLSFARLCGAYAALFNGVKVEVVAEAFYLSRTSVSNLAGCRNDLREATRIEVGPLAETHPSPSLTQRKYLNRKLRYQNVAREFDRLGEAEFLRLYYTRQIHAEIRNAAATMPS